MKGKTKCRRTTGLLVHLDSPGLQVLDPAQHVQVASRVLLDHVLHVIRPQGLFEPFLVEEELHDPARGEHSLLRTPCSHSFAEEEPSYLLTPADSLLCLSL